MTTGEEAATARRAARHFPEIEGYRITDVLGQGGMGAIVYRAVQTRLDRTVALKVLPAIVGSASPKLVDRFRHEAAAAARLHHTNIVPIYDFGESRDAYYFAMELIEGRPLNELVSHFADAKLGTAGPARVAEVVQSSTDAFGAVVQVDQAEREEDGLSGSRMGSTTGREKPYYQQVARWMADAADALHYAHGERIIHRDIKPANLILTADNRVMIADFGLAKTDDGASMTVTGSLLGTVRYLSPEQAMAKRIRVDHRTDIYSLGATMYELLCFQAVFPGSDEKEVLAAIITTDPVRLRKIVSSVPQELETICLKTLEKSPQARYPTARAMAEDLRRYLADLPIVARRPGPVLRVAKFARRHKAGVVAVGAALLLAVAIPLLVHQTYERQEETVRREAAQLVVQLERAKQLLITHKLPEAVEAYTELLDRNPTNVLALGNLAIAKKEIYNAASEKDPELLRQALECCNRALVLEPTPEKAAKIWNLKGVLFKKQKDYKAAAAAYEQAIQLDPAIEGARVNLAAVYFLDKNLGDATRTLDDALEHARAGDSQSCHPYRFLAAIRLVSGDAAEAADLLDEALRCNDHDAWAHLLKARMHLTVPTMMDHTKGLVAAVLANSHAKLIGPEIKRTLALAYLRNDNFENAIAAANEAMRLEGRPSSAGNLILAIAHAHQQDFGTAKKCFEVAQVDWPQELQKPGDYIPDVPRGELWFESYAELDALRHEAKLLLPK